MNISADYPVSLDSLSWRAAGAVIGVSWYGRPAAAPVNGGGCPVLLDDHSQSRAPGYRREVSDGDALPHHQPAVQPVHPVAGVSGRVAMSQPDQPAGC